MIRSCICSGVTARLFSVDCCESTVRFDLNACLLFRFSDPELDEEQRKEALEAGLSAEELTLKDERYLPISELIFALLYGM